MKKSFNIQELLHCKSKHHGTKPMHPSSLGAFQFIGSHNYKKNKLPYFIERCHAKCLNLCKKRQMILFIQKKYMGESSLCWSFL